jgi:hypothetical protein
VNKESMNPDLLTVMVERRLRGVPVMHAAIEQDALFALRVGTPRRHDRDSHGRNWNIDGFESGFRHWPQCQTEFRVIVDHLRDQYDMG